jgi:hypothetical protein
VQTGGKEYRDKIKERIRFFTVFVSNYPKACFKPFYALFQTIRSLPREQNKVDLKPSVRCRNSNGNTAAKVFVSFRDSHDSTTVSLLIDLECFAGSTMKILKLVHTDLYDSMTTILKLVLSPRRGIKRNISGKRTDMKYKFGNLIYRLSSDYPFGGRL